MGLAVQLGLGGRVTLYAGRDKHSGRGWYLDIEKVRPGLYRFTFHQEKNPRGIRNAGLACDLTGRTIKHLGEGYAEGVWGTVARLIPPDELEMGDGP